MLKRNDITAKNITLKSGKQITLDTSLVPYPDNVTRFKDYKGTPIGVMESREIVDRSLIYTPQGVNVVRYGSGKSSQDLTHSEKLASNIDSVGCNHNELPPVLIRKRQIIKGRVYEFEQDVAGGHREPAFDLVEAPYWIYDIYKPFTSAWEKDDAAAQDNGRTPPSLSMDKRSAENLLKKHIDGGRWKELPVKDKEEEVDAYLKHTYPSMHPNARTAVRKAVFRKKGDGWTDYIEFSPEDAMDWLEEHTKLKHSGEVDNRMLPMKAGWILADGYFDKRVYQAILKYGMEGLESYFTVHTKAPKGKVTVKTKREQMISSLDRFTQALDKVYEFKQKNGRYPFEIAYFIPQDRKGNENLEKIIDKIDI